MPKTEVSGTHVSPAQVSEARFNDVSYQRFLGEEKLMGCRCRSCGMLSVPPRPLCTHCYATDLEWVEYAGRGRLAAFTCIRIIPPTMQVWGYDRQHPYCSGVVELEEGGRVVAIIDDVDPTRPEDIRIGLPLSVRYRHLGEGDGRQTMLAFVPTP